MYKRQYKLGRIATGDIFVDDEALRRSIIERTHPDCVEMEGAAIALVAYSNQIPCLVIRSMSDNANGDVYKRQHTGSFCLAFCFLNEKASFFTGGFSFRF